MQRKPGGQPEPSAPPPDDEIEIDNLTPSAPPPEAGDAPMSARPAELSLEELHTQLASRLMQLNLDNISTINTTELSRDLTDFIEALRTRRKPETHTSFFRPPGCDDNPYDRPKPIIAVTASLEDKHAALIRTLTDAMRPGAITATSKTIHAFKNLMEDFLSELEVRKPKP